MENKIRVLEIFGEPFSNGGQESFLVNVLKAGDFSKFIIDILSLYYCDNEYYSDIIKKLGGSIYELGLPFNPGKSRFNIISKLNKFLKNKKYDVAHIHSGSISALALSSLVAKLNNVKKIIVHSHSTGISSIKHLIVKYFFSPILNYFATDFLACSIEAAKWKFTNNIVKKTKVIKNGIDADNFKFNLDKRTEYRNKFGIKENEFVVGHVGRFSKEKNHKFLIRIFEQILKLNSNSILLLIGDGKDYKNINNIVKKSSFTNKVRFLGIRKDVNELYSAMDCFVFPSLFEGLGIVLIEAQAAGLPCYISDNVPKEASVTNLCKTISLNDMPEKWAKLIVDKSKIDRIDISKKIKNAGYDIKETTKNIMGIYVQN